MRPTCLATLIALAAACAPQATTTAHEGYLDAANGVRLFYKVMGSGPDTLIVLHGGPGLTLEYIAPDFEPLAANHALLFYDQRGAGRSTLVRDSAGLDGQRFAEDLEAVRVHFKLEHVNLLGHSWGAAVAALYAARYPDRIGRLLIVDGIPLRATEFMDAFNRLAANRDSATRVSMERWMNARRANPGDAAACHAYYVLWFRPFFVDTSAMSRSKGDFCFGTPESRRNKIESVDRYVRPSLGDWDWRPALAKVTAPALVINGSADPLPVSSARNWAAAVQGGRLLVIEGVGHFSYLEAPERFFAAVDTFLRGSWPPGAEPPR